MPFWNWFKNVLWRPSTMIRRPVGLEPRILAVKTRERMNVLIGFADAVDEALGQGDTQRAVQSCRAWQNELEDIERRRDMAELREYLGYGYFDLGISFLSCEKFEDSEAAFRASIARWADLAACDPTQSWYRERVAACNNQLGIVYEWSGSLERADASYKLALDVREELRRLHPVNKENIVYLGGTLCNLGQVARRRGDPQAASDYYGRSIQIFRSVIPRCDCGCQEGLLHVISERSGYPHWILTAQKFLQNAQEGKAILAQAASS